MQKLFLYPVVWPPAPDYPHTLANDVQMMVIIVHEHQAFMTS
ncbi:hypothetical protein ECLT68_2553 [Escherichia coli LT-68]|nr:hypothetical protein ECLT68_2553 [Escherichia coli LT-68]